MSCLNCKNNNLTKHVFNTPCDYELHAEQALTSLYSGNDMMTHVMDELLYTLDQLDRSDKNTIMSTMLSDMPRYKDYLKDNGKCSNIKGCVGKSCNKECLSFKSYNSLCNKDKKKVKDYANVFYDSTT